MAVSNVSFYIYHSLTMVLLTIKFVFFISGLTFFITIVSMKLLVSPNTNENTLYTYQVLNKILIKCYHENLSPLIMSKVIDQQLSNISSLNHPISLILMDENFNQDEAQAQWTSYYPNLATSVLIIDSSLYKFYETVKNIYYSTWGVTNPNFIFVNLKNCKYVLESFKIAWSSHLMSVIYLCYHEKQNVVKLVTYNPFTDYAPYPWVKFWNNESWTLYRQNYHEDQDVCLNLMYDKTKYLNGLKINAVGMPKYSATWDPDMDYNISSLTKILPYFNAQFFINIFLKINVTPIINFEIPQLSKVKNPVVVLYHNYVHHTEKLFHPIYSFRQKSLVIITQKRPFLSAEEKILSFYSFSLILLVIIFFGTLFIALMFNKKQSWLSTMMELIRVLVSTGILQPLNRQFLRIYLFGIFLLVIIINATFQGKLVEFLTKPERHSINSIADIKNFKYKLYVNPISSYLLEDILSKMQISSNLIGDDKALEVLVNDSHVAYITNDDRAYEPAYIYQLHVSAPCSFCYQHFVTTLPLGNRIDEIASRFAESGLHDYWKEYDIDKYKMNLTNTEEMETAPQVRPLATADILFMLKFLAIGLGIAFVVFLIEVAVGHKKRRAVHVHLPLQESKDTNDEVDVISL